MKMALAVFAPRQWRLRRGDTCGPVFLGLSMIAGAMARSYQYAKPNAGACATIFWSVLRLPSNSGLCRLP